MSGPRKGRRTWPPWAWPESMRSTSGPRGWATTVVGVVGLVGHEDD